jgi:hypothetical protein
MPWLAQQQIHKPYESLKVQLPATRTASAAGDKADQGAAAQDARLAHSSIPVSHQRLTCSKAIHAGPTLLKQKNDGLVDAY